MAKKKQSRLLENPVSVYGLNSHSLAILWVQWNKVSKEGPSTIIWKMHILLKIDFSS